jgi:hypothetical protein
MSDNFDFNNAGEQRSFDVIPADTIVTLQMVIRPGGAGDGGWLKPAANGASEGLDCEFIVIGGPYDRRKLWQWFILRGTTPGHEQAGEFSRNTLRAILESARGIRSDDKSETAQAARKITGWHDFENLRFIAKLDIRPPQDGYKAKNVIAEVITPERQGWHKPEQITVAKPMDSGMPATPPANAITRPRWAG